MPVSDPLVRAWVLVGQERWPAGCDGARSRLPPHRVGPVCSVLGNRDRWSEYGPRLIAKQLLLNLLMLLPGILAAWRTVCLGSWRRLPLRWRGWRWYCYLSSCIALRGSVAGSEFASNRDAEGSCRGRLP